MKKAINLIFSLNDKNKLEVQYQTFILNSGAILGRPYYASIGEELKNIPRPLRPNHIQNIPRRTRFSDYQYDKNYHQCTTTKFTLKSDSAALLPFFHALLENLRKENHEFIFINAPAWPSYNDEDKRGYTEAIPLGLIGQYLKPEWYVHTTHLKTTLSKALSPLFEKIGMSIEELMNRLPLNQADAKSALSTASDATLFKPSSKPAAACSLHKAQFEERKFIPLKHQEEPTNSGLGNDASTIEEFTSVYKPRP